MYNVYNIPNISCLEIKNMKYKIYKAQINRALFYIELRLNPTITYSIST